MDKGHYIRHFSALFAVISLFLPGEAQAQLSVNATGTTYTIDFSTTLSGVNNGAYTGAGFQAGPSAGRLDSDAWAVTGWSNGSLAFGGTQTTAATDYTRGATAVAVTTGGFYAYTGAPHSAANPAFYIQPGGTDWAPGTLTLRILNNTGSPISSFTISYDLYVRNDQDRSSSLNFSYSTDDVSYTAVPALDYTSAAALNAAGYVQVGSSPSRTTTISSLSVASGAYFYVRWSSADVGGSGSRDEFGLDDIKVLAGSSCTLAAQPSTASSLLAFSDIACNALTLSWTAGDGANRMVVARAGAAVSGTPADQSSYTANATFGSGSTIAAGEFVVYQGPATSFTCYGLSESTTYHFKIFEYNGGSCQENYFTGTTLTGNQATIACSQCPGLTGALINSCQGTCTEGDNELLFLHSGSYSIPVSSANVIVKYEAASPATITYTESLTTNAAFISTLNTNAGCGTLFYDAMAVGKIPANTTFIVMRSTACYGYDFSSFCASGPVYVVFSTDPSWITSGNFANSGTAGALRYFRTDFSAVGAGCVTDYNYEPFLLTAGGDGDAVSFPIDGGAATAYFNEGCDPPTTVLPIELLYFNGQPDGRQIKLFWATATETNNAFFAIERSDDGLRFSEIGTVPGAGNSHEHLSYSFTDASPPEGLSYYRLRQNDADGAFSYSDIISINRTAFVLSAFYPNPAEDVLNVSVNAGKAEPYQIVIRNAIGQRVMETAGPVTSVNISGLPDGVYFIGLGIPGPSNHYQKFIKHSAK